MMNTYIIPVADDESNYIMSIKARSIENAQNKFMEKIAASYKWQDYPDIWDDFVVDIYAEVGVDIGSIYDVEEFA